MIGTCIRQGGGPSLSVCLSVCVWPYLMFDRMAPPPSLPLCFDVKTDGLSAIVCVCGSLPP